MLGFEAPLGGGDQQLSRAESAEVLDRLLPQSESGTDLRVRCASSSPEQLSLATRIFLPLASLYPSLQPNSSWGIGVVWERILRQGVRHLRAQAAALASFDGAGLPIAQWSYGADALARPAGSEVSDLPRRLWEQHNGGPDSADILENVHKEFAKLAPGWEFAVAGGFEVSAQPGSQVPLQLAARVGSGFQSELGSPYAPVYAIPAGTAHERSDLDVSLQVELSARRKRGRWGPLAGAATGVAQGLVLAEALGDAAGRFIFLDEPAVNLHPSWQRHIRSRLEELSASKDGGESGQFVLVTHAAPFLLLSDERPCFRSASATTARRAPSPSRQ